MDSGLMPDASPLSSQERHLLDFLLSQDFEGVESLRMQSEDVLAYPSCDCGCGSIGFEHANGVRPGPDGMSPQTRPGPFPVVQNGKGEDIGGLILFVRAGLLDDLEIYSHGADPLPLPEPGAVHFVTGK